MTTQGQTCQRNQLVVAVTTDQILCCKNEPHFRLFGIPIQIATLVGVVRNFSVDSCDVTCDLQDHFGSVQCVMHLETESEVAGKLSNINQDSYVQLFGNVRIENGRRMVNILKMVPIHDMNLITNHILQAKFFVLKAKADRDQQLASANICGTALADSVALNEEPVGKPMPQFNALQKMVYDLVKSEYSDIGISKRSILKLFPSYQGHEVNQAMYFLINEGAIYYSVDNEHLKAAIWS